MKTNKMYAVVKEPGKAPEIRLIDSNHRAFIGIINGKRQLIPFPKEKDVCIIFDGEAAASKKVNAAIPEYEDMLFGTVIVSGIDLAEGFLSLTENQADKIMQYLVVNDAKSFSGDPAEAYKKEYLNKSEENYIFEYLSEVKDKYKTIKVGWLNKR